MLNITYNGIVHSFTAKECQDDVFDLVLTDESNEVIVTIETFSQYETEILVANKSVSPSCTPGECNSRSCRMEETVDVDNNTLTAEVKMDGETKWSYCINIGKKIHIHEADICQLTQISSSFSLFVCCRDASSRW